MKLKSNIKTSKGIRILEKVERQLANERVRNINNTIATCTCLRATCIDELKDQISNIYFQESVKFIERVKETRHQTVLKRHLSKFDQLWQRFRGDCSNQETTNGHPNTQYREQGETLPAMVTDTPSKEEPPVTTSTTTTDTTTKEYINRWVRNLSSTPLTEVQVSLLVHGPNFVVAPGHPPYGDYINAIEQACLKLEPNNAEELTATMRRALRNSQEPKRNITKQEVHLWNSRMTNQGSALQQTKG